MSRRSKIRAKKNPGVAFDEAGALIDHYKADVIFQCGRCKAMLWHAFADMSASAAGHLVQVDGFQPYLVSPTKEAEGIGRLAYLHAPFLPILDWESADGSETQTCHCGHVASISRRQTFRRLREVWVEAEATGEQRRSYVDA